MQTTRRHLAGIVAINLVPVVGFIAFDWSSTVFLGVLVLDIWATSFWMLLRMPFAEKRPPMSHRIRGRIIGPLTDKRGGIGFPGPLPPIYPRNLPVLFAGFVIAAVSVGLSVALFAISAPELTGPIVGWILLGGLIVFLVRGGETVREFFMAGGYRDHSARTVGLSAYYQLWALAALLAGILGLGATVGDGTAPFVSGATLVAVIFCGKFVADIRSWQLEHDPGRRSWLARVHGSPATEPPATPVSTPDGRPLVVVRPERWPVRIDAAARGVGYLASVWGVLLLVPTIAGTVGPTWLAVLGGSGLLTIMGFRGVVRYLTIGSVEYRCYDGVIVEYDRILGAAQARLEPWAVTGVGRRSTGIGRAFRTETVELDTGYEPPRPSWSPLPDPAALPDPDPDANRPLTLPYLADPDRVLDQGEWPGIPAASPERGSAGS